MDATKPKRFLLLVIALLLLHTTMAQDGSLQKTIQLPAGRLRLDSISKIISRHSSFRFSINSSKVNASTLIDIPVRVISLDALLNKLKEKMGVPYSIVGNHIIFSDHIAEQTTLAPAKPRTIQAPKKQPAAISQPSRVAATRPAISTQPAIVNTQFAVVHRRVRTRLPLAPVNNQFGKIFGANKMVIRLPALYLHLGISSDDVMYGNVSAAFGHRWLYATGSWGTNKTLQGFRYGIGSGIDLSGDWLLRIELTTGAFKKETDSSRWKTTVKSRLHRAAFLMERKINKHLCIQGGLHVNLLQTKYFLNDEATAPSMLIPHMTKGDTRLYNIKPLYTIFDNSDPAKSTSRQLWIGAQIGVIYRLNF